MVLVSAVVILGLIAPGAVASVASAAPVHLISGTVTRVVRELPNSTNGNDEYDTMLATDAGFVPLSDNGIDLHPGQRVTVEVVPHGDRAEVVDVVASHAAPSERAEAGTATAPAVDPDI